MTGPGEGKVPLKARVFFSNKEIPCDVYLHVRGYSLARVTHLDIESDLLNLLVAPNASTYATAYTAGGMLRVRFRKAVRVEGSGASRGLVIECTELAEALNPMNDIVYVGGKEGGIFLGFRREQIAKLEALVARYGISPRSRAKH